MQDQLLTLLSSSQQPSSPGGGGGTLGNHLGGSPPSIFTSRQPSLLPTLSRTPHSPPMSSTSGHLGKFQDILQALRLGRSLCLVPPRWVCCQAGRSLVCSPAPSPTGGRRNLPSSATSSLGLRSLLSDNLSLDTGADQKIFHFCHRNFLSVKCSKTDT